MGTDRYAYRSRLKRADPLVKLWFTLTVLLVCLFCESVWVGVVTLMMMCTYNVRLGGQPVKAVLRLMRLPVLFLLLGGLPILFRAIPQGTDAVAAYSVGGVRIGMTADTIHTAATVFFQALGAVSAMYFLALNTPMTDLMIAFERLHVPKLMLELMELVYRFIFVLWDCAGRIRTAQASRLGYQGFRRSIDCMGTLVSLVFFSAWRQGDRVYAALESRGYTGQIRTLPQAYEKSGWLYLCTAATAAVQIAVYAAERRFGP